MYGYKKPKFSTLVTLAILMMAVSDKTNFRSKRGCPEICFPTAEMLRFSNVEKNHPKFMTQLRTLSGAATALMSTKTRKSQLLLTRLLTLI
jgi:hypothetical protein